MTIFGLVNKILWLSESNFCSVNPLKYTYFLRYDAIQTWYLRVFEVADYKSEFKIQKFNMADQNAKLLDLDEILYSGVTEVADYESGFKIQKFNMADQNARSYLIWMKFGTRRFFRSLIMKPNSKFTNSIWRTKMQKVTLFGWNSVLGGYWSHWITNPNSKFRNSIWRII